MATTRGRCGFGGAALAGSGGYYRNTLGVELLQEWQYQPGGQVVGPVHLCQCRTIDKSIVSGV